MGNAPSIDPDDHAFVNLSAKPYADQTLVEQLRGRATVRRQIKRADGEVDRIADVCERAANRIEELEAQLTTIERS